VSHPEPEPRETERRRATVMFADLTGFTSLVEQEGDEYAYEVVAECLKLLDEIARRHGATVDKYLGDCIMAVFGVPKAVENAPRAAVNAAIEMRERVRRFNRERGLARPLEVHTGINTGSLISGDVSGPVLREFAVMGDTVNVAARLKDLAPPGQVWVGPQTWRYTKREFGYAPVGTLQLKGKQQRVQAYEIRSEESSRQPGRAGGQRDVHSELVGREGELARLRATVSGVAGGAGRIVSLVGEPGLGKSRLLAELAASEEAQGVTWLEGRALAEGGTLSYHPFRDLFRRWLDLPTAVDDAEARRRLDTLVTELLGEAAADVHPLLATVLGVPLDAAGRRRIAAIQGDAREKMIRRAVTQLGVALAAQRPLWIALDDLHWADLSSLEMVESLLPLVESHAIGFLLVYRPHFAETSEKLREVLRARHAGYHEEIELAPLPATYAHRLLENLFRGGDVPAPIRQRILERTAGNPFFAEEVVRALLDDGALEERDGRLAATERIHAVEIPGTVQEVLMARVDALALEDRLVLQAAAVIGIAFHERVLAQVVQKDGLEGILDRLEDAGLVAERDALEGVFAFQHPLIQEVAYETILRTRRAEMHHAVGEAIEVTLTENIPGYHAMLAYHFTAANDAERSEEYLFRAGAEAASSAASNEALRFFQEAARLYTERHGRDADPRKQSLLERHVAQALFNRGRLAEAVQHFDRALAPLGGGLPHGRTRNLRAAVDLAAFLRRIQFGGLERLRPANDVEREIVAIRFERSLAQTTTAPEFVPDAISTLRALVRVDPRTVPESGGVLAGAVGIFSYGGVSFGFGRRVLDVAQRLADAGNVDGLLLYYRLMHFIHHFLAGDWSETHWVEQERIEEGLRNGRFWEVTVALDIDGECALHRGDHARVARRLDELDGLANDYGNAVALATLRSLGALLELERGALGPAFERIELYRQEHGDHAYQIVAWGTRARVELLQGRLEAAHESLARGETRIREAGLVPPLHRSFCTAPRYALALRELEAAQQAGARGRARRLAARARRSRRRALAVAAKVAACRTEVLRLAATEAWLHGRYRRAQQGYASALRVARGLGARPELARTYAEIARRLAAERGPDLLEGRDADSWRAEADELFAALGVERQGPARETTAG
jgi:class 3 adenylate cyclase/tetratricopeptide (TPR) repeat protein